MKRGNESQTRRVRASRVSKLKSRFLGATRRVKTLKRRDNEMTDIINNRSIIRVVGGVNQRVKLSKPEVDDYIVKRNDIRKQLVLARQDYKDYKADYQEAVNTNKKASKQQLKKTRESLLQKATDNVLDQFKKILSKASEEGREEEMMAFQQTALEGMTETQIRKFVKEQTGAYVPKYADLSKVIDLLNQWKVEVHKKEEVLA